MSVVKGELPSAVTHEAMDNECIGLLARQLTDDHHNHYVQGHDTTAGASSAVGLYMMACYPEQQRKLQLEVDAVLGRPRPSYSM